MRISIFDPENWREIGATLARNKTRTFLTAFGIFWGTAMLALLMGGADGLRGMMSRNFAGMATNMGALSSGQRSISYNGFNKGTSWDFTVNDCENIRRVAPFIESSSMTVYGSAKVVFLKNSKSTNYSGVEASYSKVMEPIIYSGRFINDADVQQYRKVAVVGKNVAGEIFGNDDPIGKRIEVNGVHFTVIGIGGQLSEATINNRIDDSLILPITTAQRAFNHGNNVESFVFVAQKGHKPSENKTAIYSYLSRRHSFDPKDENAVWFMDISEFFDNIYSLFLGLTILAFFVGIGSLMAGVIGVGNIMWIIVKERTHEFGIRRAIGAKPLDITIQVLSESIVLTLVAGTAGVCFATLILAAADSITADPILGHAGFELAFDTAVAIVGTFFILGSAAGTLPAIKAMKIKPIEALRDK